MLRNKIVFAQDAVAETPPQAGRAIGDGRRSRRSRKAGGAPSTPRPRGAKIWALLRQGASPQLFSRLQANVQDIEKLIGEAEWAALRGRAAS